jgi:hypothetical protein
MDQANIGRSLVIKGEVTGAESLFIDGRVEGTINFPGNRVTIGRNGNVAANITAKEVVIMGKVQGNVECADRLGHPQRRPALGRRDHASHQRRRRRDPQGRRRSAQSRKERPENQAQGPNKQEAPKAVAATAGNA